MNRRYMDFVPAKRNYSAKTLPKRQAVFIRDITEEKEPEWPTGGTIADGRVASVRHDDIVQRNVTREEIKQTVYEASDDGLEEVSYDTKADTFSIKNEPEYGVIEDYHPKFVRAEVEKRPLSKSHFVINKTEVTEIKAQKIKKRPAARDELAMAEKPNEVKGTLNIPKTPFINHNKVAKRPLSKNVYDKKIEPTKEETKGTITIIDKPDEDRKSGIVATIILTIILGAVAGTIAFLILPK